MRFLLDTNTCIAYLADRSAKVEKRLKQVPPADIALCSVVKSELLFGARKSAEAVETLERLEVFFQPFVSLPFDDHAAELAGHARAELEKAGTPIGPNDLLIAAIALAHGLIVVTHNVREFGRVPWLRVEDWTV